MHLRASVLLPAAGMLGAGGTVNEEEKKEYTCNACGETAGCRATGAKSVEELTCPLFYDDRMVWKEARGWRK